jgi:hypothetical protein
VEHLELADQVEENDGALTGYGLEAVVLRSTMVNPGHPGNYPK